MSEKKSFFILFFIMVVVSFSVGIISIFHLYEIAYEEELGRLKELAQSQARLIEAVAEFDNRYSNDYPTGSREATISQIVEAHNNYKGFGTTGEFTLAEREDDNVVFLLSHRHYDLDNPKPIPFGSEHSEAIQRALSNLSGVLVGKDYRGKIVLAAYEPVSLLNLGIVAKIDLSEIKDPFIKAGIFVLITALILIGIGAILFFHISEPILDKLKQQNIKLQQEVKDRKQSQKELKIAQKESEAANQAKSQFLANMSHEIRTPMNSIIGFSKCLIDDYKKNSIPNDFQEILEIISKSSEHLLGLINDILEIAKIESGKTELFEETINLRDLIKDITIMFDKKIDQKRIKFVANIDSKLPKYILIDRGKLTQILINLLGNAIKFTPKEKEIRLNIGREENFIIIEVKDQGIGISKEKQEKIFEPFEQADNSITRVYGGTGLGLTITKRMIELLEGVIFLESNVGLGTSIKVTIPLKESAIPDEGQKKHNEENYNFSRDNVILVIEDNKNNQKLLKTLFKKANLDIIIIDSGEEGIKKARKLNYENNPPNLILIDIHLPKMNGKDVVKQMRKIPGFNKTPIIALSADAFLEQQLEAFEAGFDDYLVKPIKFDKLMIVLKKYLDSN